MDRSVLQSVKKRPGQGGYEDRLPGRGVQRLPAGAAP